MYIFPQLITELVHVQLGLQQVLVFCYIALLHSAIFLPLIQVHYNVVFTLYGCAVLTSWKVHYTIVFTQYYCIIIFNFPPV